MCPIAIFLTLVCCCFLYFDFVRIVLAKFRDTDIYKDKAVFLLPLINSSKLIPIIR